MPDYRDDNRPFIPPPLDGSPGDSTSPWDELYLDVSGAGARSQRYGSRPLWEESASVINESLGNAIRAWGNAVKAGTVTIDDVPEHMRGDVSHYIDYISDPANYEEVPEDELLNGDPDLTGDTTAGDLQTSAYMSAMQQATSAQLETILGSPDSDIQQELMDILNNKALFPGGVGVEINPEDGDSFLLKLPIPLPIPGGVLKIKFRECNAAGACWFLPLPDIIGEVTTKVKAAGSELLALPGKLIDQAKGILGDLIETGEIVAGTSEEDILGKIADIFGGILVSPSGSGMETPSWILEGLRTKLTNAVYNSGVIPDEPDPLTPKDAAKKPEDEPEPLEVTDVVPDIGDPIRPTTTETTTDEPLPGSTPTTEVIVDKAVPPPEPPVSPEVVIDVAEPPPEPPVVPEVIAIDPLPNVFPPPDDLETELEPPFIPPPPETETPPSEDGAGGGGGAVSGMFDPHFSRSGLDLPQFVAVPYNLRKDYIVSLDRIMRENMSSDREGLFSDLV